MAKGILNPLQLLELNVISAQDLHPVTRKIRTYAVVWVRPNRKLTTRVDSVGNTNPTWNDKFVFRVDDEFLHGDTSAVMIEIYATHWFRDVHVGTVRVLVGNLLPPTDPHHHLYLGTTARFVALQVRRPSGRPQGILNIGVTLLDSSRRSMPLYSNLSSSAVGYRHFMGQEDSQYHRKYKKNNKKDDNCSDEVSYSEIYKELFPPWVPKPELRRTRSEPSSVVGSSVVGQRKIKQQGKKAAGGSMVNGSDLNLELKNNSSKGRASNASSMLSINFSKRKGNTKLGSLVGGLAKSKYELEVLDTPPEPVKEKLDSSSESGIHRQYVSKLNGPKKKEHPEKYRSIITESELGPSASEVAAMVARNSKYKAEETESEIMGEWGWENSEEGLQSKLERWRTEMPPVYDWSSLPTSSNAIDTKRGGRHSIGGDDDDDDDDDGAFSCFGRFCGLECSITCGGPGNKNKGELGRRTKSLSYLGFVD